MDTIGESVMAKHAEGHDRQSGFTLVETMMAICILGGGLLALATAFAQGMAIMSTSHYHHVAKEKASESIESIFTARDTLNLDWDEVNNKANNGIFLNGEREVRRVGDDGLANTDDDGDIETAILPGRDNLMNTPDDVEVPLSHFTREVTITEINANLRRLQVTIRYSVGPVRRQYQLTSFISRFS